jgi:hypothetical protein
MSFQPFTIVQGLAEDYPTQTWFWGGITQAAYSVDDTLTAYCYQARLATAIFQPAVGWYTGNPPGSQNGYDQGQVVISITNAQSALLNPTIAYTLLVKWSPAADSSKTAAIVRVKLIVSAPAFP